MAYCEIPATGPIAPFIRCFWTLTPEPLAPKRERTFESLRSPWMLAADPAARFTEPLLPDGSTEVVFQLGDPVRESREREPLRPMPESGFVGQLTRPRTLAPEGTPHMVGIRFRAAGAAAFVQADQRTLRDRVVPLDTVTPAFRGVRQRVAACRSWPRRARVLEDVCNSLLLRGLVRRPDPVVFRAAQDIDEAAGGERIDELAARHGISSRRLLRLFHRHVGVSPKLLARIVRFQRIFRLLQETPEASWSALALSAGYYDQAHLVREFREFADGTPEAFLREWREIGDWLSSDAA